MIKLCDEPLERQDGCAYEPIVPPVCTTQNHDTTSARHVRTAAESPAPPHAIALGHQLPGRQFSSSLCHARTAAGWRGREQGGLPYLGGCALRMCWRGPADSVPAQQCPSHALLLTSSLALIGVLAAHRRVYVAPLVLAVLILVGLALGAPGPASRQSRTQLPTNERVQQQGAPAMHSTVQPDTALAAAVA